MRKTIGSIVAGVLVLGAAAGIIAQQHDTAGADPRSSSSAGAPAAAELDPTTAGEEPRPIGDPQRVRIPAIDVDESLHGVGLTPEQEMEMPDYGEAAWYDEGARPGEPGAAVIVAHVRGPQGPDVFWDLKTLEIGDTITTTDSLGSTTWVVDRIEQVKKEQLPYDRIWPETDEPLLRLITCAGTPGPGGFPDNTVVYAHPA